MCQEGARARGRTGARVFVSMSDVIRDKTSSRLLRLLGAPARADRMTVLITVRTVLV
jgi:hypothetical protein